MNSTNEPQLLTPGRLAEALDVPLHRVQHVLKTRDIRPIARAGTLRLYNKAAVDRVREELDAMDARRGIPGRCASPAGDTAAGTLNAPSHAFVPGIAAGRHIGSPC